MLTIIRAFRLGLALLALSRSGKKWMVHSSWCADEEYYVAVVRDGRPEVAERVRARNVQAQHAALGRPVAGHDLLAVLRRALQ